MITIFNEKELLVTYDVEIFANARDELKNAGIEFKARSKFFNGAAVSANKNTKHRKYGTTYFIYVKEKDYNRAIHIIHSKEGWK